MIFITYNNKDKIQGFKNTNYTKLKDYIQSTKRTIKNIYTPINYILFFEQHFPDLKENIIILIGLEETLNYTYPGGYTCYYRFPKAALTETNSKNILMSNIGWPADQNSVLKISGITVLNNYQPKIPNTDQLLSKLNHLSNVAKEDRILFYGSSYPGRKIIFDKLKKSGIQIVHKDIELRSTHILDQLIENECSYALSLDGHEILCFRDTELALGMVPTLRLSTFNSPLDLSMNGAFFCSTLEVAKVQSALNDAYSKLTSKNFDQFIEGHKYALGIETLRQSYNAQIYAALIEIEFGFMYLKEFIVETIKDTYNDNHSKLHTFEILEYKLYNLIQRL